MVFLTHSVVSECYPIVAVALMESVRSLDASCLPLNRDQFMDLASSLNEFFAQNGFVKSEPSNSDHAQQMIPMNFHQQMSPQIYQNYPCGDDQTSSTGT